MKKIYSCIVLFFVSHFAFSQFNLKTSSYKIDLNHFRSAEMVKTIKNSLNTELSLNTPVGEKEFIVTVSKNIESGSPDIEFFEGYVKDNPKETVFIQVRPSGTTISYTNRNNGDDFTLAKSEQIVKAAFKETIDKELISKHPSLRSEASSMIRSAGNEYSWVDEKKTHEFIADNKALLGVGESSQVCNTVSKELSQTKTTTAKGNDELIAPAQNFTFGSVMGRIGKREIRLALYDYGDVSEYDWNKCIAFISRQLTSYTDDRFKNVLLKIDEYFVKNGVAQKNGIKITSSEFKWNNGDDSATKVAEFKTYLQKRFPERMEANYKHLLLSRNNSFSSDIKGVTITNGGNVAMANVWSIWIEFKSAPHEFGHMINCEHAQTCEYGAALGWWSWYSDLMSPGLLCYGVYFHSLTSNKDRIDRHMSEHSYCNEILDAVTPLPNITDLNYAEDLMITTGNTATKYLKLQESLNSQYINYSGQLYDTPNREQLAEETLGGLGGIFWGVYGPMDHIYVYKVKFPQYNYYMIKTITTDGDPYITLLDKNGDYVTSDDDSGGGTKSKIAGYFNGDWYYVIVGGYRNKPHNFKLKIRYGWWEGGEWKAAAVGTNLDKSNIPMNTPIGEAIDKGDGNIIYEADFGLNSKTNSVSSSNLDSKIKLYPNPVKDRLNISIQGYSGSISYELFDLSGRKVLANTINYNDAKAIDLKGLQSGTYIINIEGVNLNFSENITVK